MSIDPSPRQDSQNSRLADVLDRLAGALEQQARAVEGLKGEVRALGEGVKRVEARLEALEQRPTPATSGDTPPRPVVKAAAKKRGK